MLMGSPQCWPILFAFLWLVYTSGFKESQGDAGQQQIYLNSRNEELFAANSMIAILPVARKSSSLLLYLCPQKQVASGNPAPKNT
jgi:hypothetical protein